MEEERREEQRWERQQSECHQRQREVEETEYYAMYESQQQPTEQEQPISH
jgi:hypothetical protein